MKRNESVFGGNVTDGVRSDRRIPEPSYQNCAAFGNKVREEGGESPRPVLKGRVLAAEKPGKLKGQISPYRFT